MLSNVHRLGPNISEDAERFIKDHSLDETIREMSELFKRLASEGVPIQKVEIQLADDWDDGNSRLLVTVKLGGNMHQAFHAWRDVRPSLTETVAKAERDGFIEFEFAPVQQ